MKENLLMEMHEVKCVTALNLLMSHFSLVLRNTVDPL